MLQIAVGRGYHPDVYLEVRGSANAPEGGILQESQDLGLRRSGHVAYLIEEQGAAVRQFG